MICGGVAGLESALLNRQSNISGLIRGYINRRKANAQVVTSQLIWRTESVDSLLNMLICLCFVWLDFIGRSPLIIMIFIIS